MDTMMYFTFVFAAAIIWALLEIQIEGENGWAGKLPTWRFIINVKYFWQNEITGYHVFLMIFIILLLHTPFLYVPWSIFLEMQIVAFYLLVNTLEDFLWFILNPAFGLSKFDKEHIPWHRNWVLGLPSSYWLTLPAGFFLYAFSISVMNLL